MRIYRQVDHLRGTVMSLLRQACASMNDPLSGAAVQWRGMLAIIMEVPSTSEGQNLQR